MIAVVLKQLSAASVSRFPLIRIDVLAVGTRRVLHPVRVSMVDAGAYLSAD